MTNFTDERVENYLYAMLPNVTCLAGDGAPGEGNATSRSWGRQSAACSINMRG